jgi:[acyl-carrier-protein] S-malonyltransferase
MLFTRINNLLNFDLLNTCFEENQNINKTEFAQSCIHATNIACYEALKQEKIQPDYLLGLSLGEYSALYSSGVIDFEDCVRLIDRRSKFMAEDCNKKLGVMSAVLNLDAELINNICEKSNHLGYISISNYNTIGQIVIGGELEAIEFAEKLIKENKGKSIRLKVSGAFHTEMFKDSSEKLNLELKKIRFEKFKTSVVSNLNANIISEKDNLVDILTNQVIKPVKFHQSIEFLLNKGVDTFIEVGPSKALAGFVKKINSDVKIFNVFDMESLKNTVSNFKR